MAIVHRPGASHQNGDALSRRPCERIEKETACRQCRRTGREKDSRAVSVMTRSQLSATAKENTKRLPGCEIDLSGSDQSGPKGRGLPANYPRSVGRWVGEAAMVHRRGSRLGGTTAVRSVGNITAKGWHLVQEFGQVRWTQLLVPRSLRALLLQHLQAGPTAGHMGVKKTQDRVMKMAYWRRWRADVAMFCRRCTQCNRYRRGPGVRQGELQQATAAGPKWQLLTTGPWKVERVLNSVKYVIRRIGGRDRRIVHVDRLQRYVEAAPDGVVLASQLRPNCKDLLSPPRPCGSLS